MKNPEWLQRRDAKRRQAIKRQLRLWGVCVYKDIMYDIGVLRKLRNENGCYAKIKEGTKY